MNGKRALTVSILLLLAAASAPAEAGGPLGRGMGRPWNRRPRYPYQVYVDPGALDGGSYYGTAPPVSMPPSIATYQDLSPSGMTATTAPGYELSTPPPAPVRYQTPPPSQTGGR
ncbi:MAG TPA: hypothetical protein VK395_20195 [Gemmataceae bacterium]|nr:hypothetical protein [Gemmataceae bacterium]